MSEHSDAEDDEDDVLDDAEIARLSKVSKNRVSTFRPAVAAEKWEKKADWVPPMHKKTPEQYEKIKEAASVSFIFSSLEADQLKIVIDAFMGPQNVAPGTEVITQDAQVAGEDPGLFIIESGTLDVFKKTSADQHPGMKVFTYNKFGQTFGEAALLYDCPRQATVLATSPSVVWSIDRDTFNNCVKAAQLEMRQRFDSFLQTVDILKDLTPQDRIQVADVIRPITFQKGDTIIKKGTLGKDFFMLEKGRAQAIVDGAVVKEYSPGSYFGELALLRNQPRAVDVIAAESPTMVASLDGPSFRRLLDCDRLLAEAQAAYGTPAEPNSPKADLDSPKSVTTSVRDKSRKTSPEPRAEEMSWLGRLLSFGFCSCTVEKHADSSGPPPPSPGSPSS
eukprot:gnl/TRDRNA2_/TRDRNA2_133203_c1_seq1.p1 gnl/TRDRNA2_/TRDRNA2_133203_c1~~gnl/TRDRNA2_/TRDRNA2_133203_c1_seq1.p1  ORF type:complete len:391 (-),score=88.07 gnl/TRDRNA2_/TRDRNA2_133203_c1_seq1:96-1268(-)